MDDIKLPRFPQKSPAEYFEIAMDAIKRITGLEVTPDQMARLFAEAGRVCDQSGEWDQALESYERALEMCENEAIKAEVLKQSGHIRSKRGEWEIALESYNESLEIMNRLGNLNEIGNLYNSIGYNYFGIGDMAKTKEYYDKALEIGRQCDDVQLISDVQNNLGILTNVQGKLDDAVAHYRQSRLGYEAIGDDHGLAQVYHNLAMTYMGKRDWELAGEYYQRSMELCIQIRDLYLISVIYANKAQFALHLHAPYVAKSYCDKAFEVFEKTGNKLGMAEAYKLYGIIYMAMQKWSSARESFQQGLVLCEESNNQLTKAEIYYELGALSNKEDERQEALSHMQEAVEIYETLGVEREAKKIRNEMQAIAI